MKQLLNYDVILQKLEQEYKDLGCALNFSSPFELLVATMLSAQTTDVTVNKATEKLFKVYSTPEEFAALEAQELEPFIRTCGFYKTKAANIIKTSRLIMDKHNGRVPDTMEDLTSLPGVGRKTANVVMSNAFGKDAIAVDTHVFRVANRLGLADAKDVVATENQLMENIPRDKWSMAHHWLIWHGRRVCSARKPNCQGCMLKDECKFFQNIGE